MTTSFITHYLGWQSARGFIGERVRGHLSEWAFSVNLTVSERALPGLSPGADVIFSSKTWALCCLLYIVGLWSEASAQESSKKNGTIMDVADQTRQRR
jgi:hypothetical protein